MTTSLKDLKPEHQRKVLLYGDSGAGKTVFAGTFPAPIYIFDFDNKVSSLVARAKSDPELQKKIDADQIHYDVYAPDKGKPGNAGKRFNEKLDEFDKQMKEGKFPYKTLVFDSMTTMVDEIIKYLMNENKGITRAKTNIVIQPSMQDYMLNSLFLTNLLTVTLKFPVNILYTAHIERIKDEKSGELCYAPMFPGKLAPKLPIYFEEVYRAYVNPQGVHCAQTKPDKKYAVIRSQIHKLPTEMRLHFDELIKQR